MVAGRSRPIRRGESSAIERVGTGRAATAGGRETGTSGGVTDAAGSARECGQTAAAGGARSTTRSDGWSSPATQRSAAGHELTRPSRWTPLGTTHPAAGPTRWSASASGRGRSRWCESRRHRRRAGFDERRTFTPRLGGAGVRLVYAGPGRPGLRTFGPSPLPTDQRAGYSTLVPPAATGTAPDRRAGADPSLHAGAYRYWLQHDAPPPGIRGAGSRLSPGDPRWPGDDVGRGPVVASREGQSSRPSGCRPSAGRA